MTGKARVELVDPKVPSESAAGQRVRHLMNQLAAMFVEEVAVAVFVVLGPDGEVHGATKFDPSLPDVVGVPVVEMTNQLFLAASSAVDKCLHEMTNPYSSEGRVPS